MRHPHRLSHPSRRPRRLPAPPHPDCSHYPQTPQRRRSGQRLDPQDRELTTPARAPTGRRAHDLHPRLAAPASATIKSLPVCRGIWSCPVVHRRLRGRVGSSLVPGATGWSLHPPFAPDLAAAVAQAGVDITLEGRALQEALRHATASRRGYCDWTVDHASWAVMLYSPEEQVFYGKTLEEALAWCLVWLMAPELGIGPFVVSPIAAADTGDPVSDNIPAKGMGAGQPTVCHRRSRDRRRQ
jgi:hypothetical protein